MGYAGIQTMLLTYKMRKADKEFELTQITNEYIEAQSKYTAVNDELKQLKAGLNPSDDEYSYEVEVEALDAEYDSRLEKIAAWEDELQQKQSNCETEISMLNGYIDSWSKALTTNIQKAHDYGPKASG